MLSIVMTPKHLLNRLCFAFGLSIGLSLTVHAQTDRNLHTPQALYEEGSQLFRQKQFAAAASTLKSFVARTADKEDDRLQEAQYMLVCTAYELQAPNAARQIRAYLDAHPHTSHANRLYALLASCKFYEAKYDEALALFNYTRLELLGDEERDERTYQRAISLLKCGDLTEAAIWLETLRNSRAKQSQDATYHLAYIRYTQGRYAEALHDLLPLMNTARYEALAPYYVAEIYSKQGQYAAAQQVARDFVQRYPHGEHLHEMQRILGEAAYHQGNYAAASKALEAYVAATGGSVRRDALYRLGMSLYQERVYSKAATRLGQVATGQDALSQNAALHRGLSLLELADKHNARLAFEQAASSQADATVREQAFYNYVLCLHETAFSPFGESVHAFERFLNEFPQSAYADRVGSYLTEVYLNSRNYEAALQSIDRITHPSPALLSVKQQLLLRLGKQDFTNSDLKRAHAHFDAAISMGTYAREVQAEAYYWRGETSYRQGHSQAATADLTRFLQLTSPNQTDLQQLAHYTLGYMAYNNQAYSRAEQHFRTVVTLRNEKHNDLRADAYNRLGDCALQARRFAEALQFYAEASRTDSRVADYSLYRQALVKGLQRDYTAKVNLLDRLVSQHPDSPYAVEALYEKGRSYVLTEDNARALTAFRTLAERYPDSPAGRKAFAEMALLHHREGNYEAAISAYRHILQAYPGSEEARMAGRDLKSIYVEQNRVDEYIALANAMPGQIRFEAGEQDSLSYVAAERIYMNGRTAEARTALQRYLQSYPNGSFALDAHHYLARIGRETSDANLLMQHSEAFMTYPHHPAASKVIGWRAAALMQSKQPAEALAAYELLKSKASEPGQRIEAEAGILHCAHLLNDDAKTIHTTGSLLSEATLSPELRNEALYFRARAYAQQKATAQALADWRTLAADTRTLYGAEAKYRVAESLALSQQYEAAERELLDYMERSTPHAYWLARSFILLADVYIATGKTVEARQYLLSLKQNYQANDDIAALIEARLAKLNS